MADNHLSLFQIIAIVVVLAYMGVFDDNNKTSDKQPSNYVKEFISSGTKSLSSNNETSADKVKKEEVQHIEYQRISLRELERELEENAARAQQNYQGKYVEFEGKLGNIDANGEYFSVESGYFSSFHCSIRNDQQKQVLISKNKGNTVYVKGKITRVGEILGYRVDVMELR